MSNGVREKSRLLTAKRKNLRSGTYNSISVNYNHAVDITHVKISGVRARKKQPLPARVNSRAEGLLIIRITGYSRDKIYPSIGPVVRLVKHETAIAAARLSAAVVLRPTNQPDGVAAGALLSNKAAGIESLPP